MAGFEVANHDAIQIEEAHPPYWLMANLVKLYLPGLHLHHLLALGASDFDAGACYWDSGSD